MTGSSTGGRTRGILLIAMVILAIAGVADGWYLTMVHVDYELGKPSDLVQVCGKLAAHGCAVTTGRFGDLMGIPVSIIGLGGAAATALTAAMAWRHRHEAHDPWRGTTFALAAFSVLVSLLMGMLSALEGSFCPFCLAWYGINLGLGILAWKALGDRQDTSLQRIIDDGLAAPGLAVLAAFGLSFAVGYWGYGERRASVLAELSEITDALVEKILASEEPVEISLEGLPIKGPEDATLTVVEVADFQCPHCRRLWEGVSAYGERSSASLRVAFVHYPLDDKCNPGMQGTHPVACDAAVAAECARRHGKFFEYGDLLFAHQPAFDRDALVGYAGELGLPEDEFRACLDDDAAELEVRRSIARAILMGVDATPTFYVNGYKFRGARPPDWIALVFDKLAE